MLPLLALAAQMPELHSGIVAVLLESKRICRNSCKHDCVIYVRILIATRARSETPELQCYRCSRSQLRCQNYILALSRCSSNPNAYVAIHASMIVSYTLEFSSLLAQKKVPDKGPDRLYRNPLIVRLISLRLAPSSKGVAGLHRSYVSPPLLIRDIKYSINITA